LEIHDRAAGGVTIVQLDGNLDTNTAPDAQVHFDGLANGGQTRIVVDFGSLNYISSAGLRVLLATAKKLKGMGGQLRMFGLNDTVHEVFEISGFSTIFSVFTTEAEALEGF
jgi:anti-sigma B factor antagonist